MYNIIQATVVGVALYDPRDGGRLRQLVVVPGYRGQGLGCVVVGDGGWTGLERRV